MVERKTRVDYHCPRLTGSSQQAKKKNERTNDGEPKIRETQRKTYKKKQRQSIRPNPSCLCSSNDIDLWVRFPRDCFDILPAFLHCSCLFSVVGSHMQSWSLFRLHDTSVVRSVKPPLTSMCSNDEENVCVVPVSISTLISGARENLGVGCFEVVHFQELHSSLRLPCTLVSCLSEYTVTERWATIRWFLFVVLDQNLRQPVQQLVPPACAVHASFSALVAQVRWL